MTPCRRSILLAVQCVVAAACGQDELHIPEEKASGMCGDYYPGSAEDGSENDVWGIEEDKIFPCIAFETARLAGEDTYIHFAEEYLKASHGGEYQSIIIVVSADNCPGCAVLIEDIAGEEESFEASRTLLIGVSWCDNTDVEDCDFDIDEAEAVLESEGWPVDKWPVTNDAEGHLRPDFGDAFPSAIVIRLRDMRVLTATHSPTAEALLEEVE